MAVNTEKSTNAVTVDDILQKHGSFGRFNIFNYIMILIPVFSAGLYSSVYNFEAMDINYRCSVPECSEDPTLFNFTIPQEKGRLSKCHRFTPLRNVSNVTFCSAENFDTSNIIGCEKFEYLEDHSIVKEFNLACQDWKRSLVGTVHNAGFFISIPLTGFISDRYGRKIAVVFTAVSNGIFGVIRGLSANYEMFVVFEFLEPAFGAGIYTACFVLALELVVPKGRVFASLLFNTTFILGGVTVTLLSWYLQNWRNLIYVIYTPSIFLIFHIWTLTESFRWLLSKGQYEKGMDILKKADKINNANVPVSYYDEVEKQAMQQREMRKSENVKLQQSGFNQLLRSPMIWKRTLIISFLWASSTLVYYGLSINAIELSGNRYLNYIVVIVIEFPANICKLLSLDRFGRKKVISTAYFCSAIILISYGFVPAGTWSLVFYLAGKFFITLAYNSLYVFAAEVFPTNYRTTLLGLCSTIGRIGSTTAPQTPLLAKFWAYLPTTLFGIVAVLCALIVFTLPETNKQKLPDTLTEAEDQDKPHNKQGEVIEPVEKEYEKTRL